MLFNHLFIKLFFVLILFVVISACNSEENYQYDVSLTVTATAYNSIGIQTKKGYPSLAAWGDTIKPGEKAIAVSRDLIKKGLTHNRVVKIEGLKGEYIVKDKMNKRWTNKIDIFMGLDERAAREWGKKKVQIKYDTLN